MHGHRCEAGYGTTGRSKMTRWSEAVCIIGIGFSEPLFSANSIIVFRIPGASTHSPLCLDESMDGHGRDSQGFSRGWEQHVDTLSLVQSHGLTRRRSTLEEPIANHGRTLAQGSQLVTVLGLGGGPEGLLACRAREEQAKSGRQTQGTPPR